MVYLKIQRAGVCRPGPTVMAVEARIRSGATLSGYVLTLLILLSGVFPGAKTSTDPEDTPDTYTDEAIERLSHVFGIEKVPDEKNHRSPPEYMVDLYNSVAYSDGITKTAAPYDADVVRGFADKATTHQMLFRYNVSHIRETESVLEAEFHLYKLRSRGRYRRMLKAIHVIELKLYQILDEERLYTPQNLKLLDFRRVSAHEHGWQTFQVTSTVQEWVNNSDTNHGFLVRASSLQGEYINDTYLRFAQRNEHHDSKQPVLVVFTEEDRMKLLAEDDELEESVGDISPVESRRQKYVQFMNEGHRAKFGPSPYKRRNYMSPQMHKKLTEEGKSRVKRASDSYYKRYNSRRRKRTCQRQVLKVDFDRIGWSGWIISPKGFQAFHCKGPCPFPLGQNQKPTNHATVQSIIHALRIVKDVETPCCVPNKLYPISLLYFDDDENVILKQYDDMVAASCGCH